MISPATEQAGAVKVMVVTLTNPLSSILSSRTGPVPRCLRVQGRVLFYVSSILSAQACFHNVIAVDLLQDRPLHTT